MEFLLNFNSWFKGLPASGKMSLFLVVIGVLFFAIGPRFRVVREKQFELVWWEQIVAIVPLFIALLIGMVFLSFTDFSLLLSRKWSRTESTSKIALLEYLKKNSKIHEVHCSYACELRDANLKRWLLDLWMQAAEKHRFRTKLVRNFARIFNRLLKPHAEAQMQEGVKAIRAVKKPLHRAGQRAKPKKNSPQKTERSEVAKTQGGGGAGGRARRW